MAHPAMKPRLTPGSSPGRRWKSPVHALWLTAALAVTGGCRVTETASSPPEEQPRPSAQADLHPERRGIGMEPLPARAGTSAQATTVDVRRSLAVTDELILQQFPFEDVMNQLVLTSGVPTTALETFHRWWDTALRQPGLFQGPACDDELTSGQPSFNSFPYSCPRREGEQARNNPFLNPTSNPDAYIPIGLFNRFDLAPTDGADCGEYRLVFARTSGITNQNDRNLLIFEAMLPNPNPGQGLEGCRPVANFWRDLSQVPDPAVRASKLRSFYFSGLPGFLPVLHIDNLGNRSGPTGQVRTNQFMQANWLLREFKLRVGCGGACVQFTPVTVKTNPGGLLFNPKSPHPLAFDFQNIDFPSQVRSLSINDIHRFDMTVPDRYNSGQGDSQSTTENHYVNQFGTSANPFRTGIQLELTASGSPLTPDHIVARAMALSCAGCHQLSDTADLGGGITWPRSLGFVHVAESPREPSPDGGNRFPISPALIQVFLPHRKDVFEDFLNGGCGDLVCQAWENPSLCPTDCP